MSATASACSTFDEVLEIVDRLSVDEQECLLVVVRNRVAARRREELIASCREAECEFEEGHYRVCSAEELIDEIMS